MVRAKKSSGVVATEPESAGMTATGTAPESFEATLSKHGCDVALAKAALLKLKVSFTHGIPDAVIERWVAEYVPISAIRGVLLRMARSWENE
jgi:hypothetical protein